jgi:hypothetical protein
MITITNAAVYQHGSGSGSESGGGGGGGGGSGSGSWFVFVFALPWLEPLRPAALQAYDCKCSRNNGGEVMEKCSTV